MSCQVYKVSSGIPKLLVDPTLLPERVLDRATGNSQIFSLSYGSTALMAEWEESAPSYATDANGVIRRVKGPTYKSFTLDRTGFDGRWHVIGLAATYAGPSHIAHDSSQGEYEVLVDLELRYGHNVPPPFHEGGFWDLTFYINKNDEPAHEVTLGTASMVRHAEHVSGRYWTFAFRTPGSKFPRRNKHLDIVDENGEPVLAVEVERNSAPPRRKTIKRLGIPK